MRKWGRRGRGEGRCGTASDHVDRGGKFVFYSVGDGELWKVLEQREDWDPIHGCQRYGRNGEWVCSPAVRCEVRVGEEGPLGHNGSTNGYPLLSIYYELL